MGLAVLWMSFSWRQLTGGGNYWIVKTVILCDMPGTVGRITNLQILGLLVHLLFNRSVFLGQEIPCQQRPFIR